MRRQTNPVPPVAPVSNRCGNPLSTILGFAVLAVLTVAGPVLADSIHPGHTPGPFGEYVAGTSTSIPMVRVPGEVPGPKAPNYEYRDPSYDFWMGKYEVTNAQFAAFLNDAQLDGGATGRGSNMLFQPSDGWVRLPNNVASMFKPQNVDLDSRIIYDSAAPLGSRYTAVAGFENHPVTHVSWLGAVKFSNWLTIDQGLGEQQRAYTEGFNVIDWHPVTITTANYATRDLNDAERQTLVDNVKGFRLPMDNLPIDWFFDNPPENRFNEWYKAAAYDPRAPDFDRNGINNAHFNPDHWMFGFGSDTLTGADANFADSGDPFEIPGPLGTETTPVGFYDGRIYNPDGSFDEDQIFDPGDFLTNANKNPYGLFDLSGNVTEWSQDIAGLLAYRAAHGGSWINAGNLAGLWTIERYTLQPNSLGPSAGFRIVQIPEPSSLLPFLVALPFLRRRRVHVSSPRI